MSHSYDSASRPEELSALAALARRLQARVNRAVQHGEELSRLIQDWMATEPIRTEIVVAPDRLWWELRVDVSSPPYDDWATAFGDGVHNLRAALDNLVWGLATLGGNEPIQPTRVQFPIVERRSEWRMERARISALPPAAQAAIELVQPFQRSGPDGEPASDALLLLNRLSNREKHRLAIEPTMTPSEISHACSVDFGSDEAAELNVPPDVVLSADAFVQGAVLIRQVTKTPILDVKGEYAFKGQVVVIDSIAGGLGVTTILSQLAHYVPQVINLVLQSSAAAIDTPDASASASPIGPEV